MRSKRTPTLIFTAICALVAAAFLAPRAAHARDAYMCTVEWAPYYGEKLPREGFITAIVKTAFERAGDHPELEFMPWARAMKEVQEGRCDMLMGAYYSDERAKTYYSSDPIYVVKIGLVARADLGISSYKSLRDLKRYVIGITRGFANSEAFDAADYLKKETADKQVLNMRKLFAHRLDMTVASFARFRYVAAQQHRDLSKVVFLKPALKENTLNIMVSRKIKGGQQLVEDFNRGLSEIRADGTYDRILQEMGYK